MASPKSSAATVTLILILNFLFFSIASSCSTCPCTSGCNPTVPTQPSNTGKCPRDTLKLGVCADLLGLINLNLGKPPKEPCCTLLDGLADLEAAACLCTVLKANILGINLNLPINLSLLLNYCGKRVPSEFQCA